ncbi:enoyl-CoA hydratase [Aestuariivita boseongensis]|uniref:enoyl-CoA hydratase n=1 Tax=Aestuariivita boseongensis TaxID=1470562 RepID=UPI000680AFB1|nr:enoyl-CoA hydratase [Aestuariivita boseongensis]
MSILERHDTGGIAHLNMNAPERLNALSDEMLAALQAEFDSLMDDRSIRAVILSGSGKAFCAGHDLKQLTQGRQAEDGGQAYFKDLFERCSKMMLTIRKLPQPVIAQVHGIATAAGCQLVATCDLAIAAKGTKFGVNGVNIGLFCSTPMVALSRNIGTKKTFEMLTTGTFIEADQAESLGLINRAVPAGQLETEARNLAETIAGKLATAVKIGKQAYYHQLELPIERAYAYTGDVMVQNMMVRDTEEGIAAFLEKRDPDWKQ